VIRLTIRILFTGEHGLLIDLAGMREDKHLLPGLDKTETYNVSVSSPEIISIFKQLCV